MLLIRELWQHESIVQGSQVDEMLGFKFEFVEELPELDDFLLEKRVVDHHVENLSQGLRLRVVVVE